jgi:succinyl-CoA synthetase beta subunit
MEPTAKRLLRSAGVTVSKGIWARRIETALQAAGKIGYPVVGKVVSPAVIHKSDVGGVVIGIDNAETLRATFQRFAQMEEFAGMLIEETLSGIEMIVGAKADFQFGPVILVGIGGTGVELYQDTSIRMAPLAPQDVISMLNGLKAHRLIEGYRGSAPVSIEKLTNLLLAFSDFVMKLDGWFQSIDLNPVICTATDCVVADARIMLNAP